jgi:transposase
VGKRDAQQITVALMALTDARDALSANQRDAALRAVETAADLLEDVEHAPGVSIARAATRLGVSDKTVLAWIERGALKAVPNAKPRQVDRESLRLAAHAIDELREHGQDRDWLQALVDYIDDRLVRRSDAVREGLDQVRKGDLEPA